mgnify:CR=1 FL=1
MGKYSGKIRPKIIKTQDFCLLLSYRMKKTMKTPLYINVNGRLMDLSEPQVMGILNVTPDSFYAGSRSETEKDIVQRLHQIIDEGASIIDIGGYSSRPNAEHISAEEEMSRLRNGLEIIRKHSKDFGGSLTDAEVMKQAGICRNTFYKYKKEIKEVYYENSNFR